VAKGSKCTSKLLCWTAFYAVASLIEVCQVMSFEGESDMQMDGLLHNPIKKS